MVAEDCEGRLGKPREQRAETRLPGAAREQVAAEADEVGLPLRGPLNGALDRDGAARGEPEVEVGEVNEPQAVELLREPRDGNLDAAEPDPAGLEPAPGDGGGPDGRDGSDQTCNFSSTGSTETT